MLKRCDGVLLFDLTQLVLRAALPTPSGIGRVELAYAKHLLANHSTRVRFIFAFTRFVKIIPNNIAARYIKEIEWCWQKEDGGSDSVAKKIEKFLELDVGTLTRTSKRLFSSNSKRAIRLRLLSEIAVRISLSVLNPRNLAIFSNSVARNVYISVSNSVIGSNWLKKWLARSPSVSAVYLLHDIIPITNPEYTLPSRTVRHGHYVKRLAADAKAIVANSDYTRECFEIHARQNNLRVPEILVAPLGVDADFKRIETLSSSGNPYFVFIGTIEPRKNHILLLQVWQRLVQKLGADCPKLLLIGRRGWENENVLDLLDRGATIQDHVLECADVPDHLLIKILANARAALFPSLVEGYGLPIAEALAVGAPVICSDLPPFREIAGDIPDYVDPLAGRGWIRLIAAYSRPNSDLREQQVERMRGFEAPSWERHMAVLDDFLTREGLADLPIRAFEYSGPISFDELQVEPANRTTTHTDQKRVSARR